MEGLECQAGARIGLVAPKIQGMASISAASGCRLHLVTPERAAARSHAE